MPYRVFWSPEAERLFKSIHADSAEPSDVMRAAREIDERLHSDPHEFGESRDRSFRIGFEHPLRIHFEVLDDVATVIVFDVWIAKRKSR